MPPPHLPLTGEAFKSPPWQEGVWGGLKQGNNFLRDKFSDFYM